jgi:hypothetical protein
MSTVRDWAELTSQNERLAGPADRAGGRGGTAAGAAGRRTRRGTGHRYQLVTKILVRIPGPRASH